ncbi:universal stress protein [Micropruina sp.]|uniref:universal stress protein n=1 Tax=Micropruina sp. TaxID=2737536 RepID=UPI002637FF9E|nr:universal stress protein [Micropruina sp.]
MLHQVPQPSPERMTPFGGGVLVVGVRPGSDPLVVLTAAALARTTGGVLYFAYVDEQRYTEREFPDGTVQHSDINPDAADDSWQRVEARIKDELAGLLADSGLSWQFRYLAGRPDRSLTHLARAVDAAAIVVGNRAPEHGAKVREFMDGALALKLAQHQHRPVLAVPLSVVDWKAPMPWA